MTYLSEVLADNPLHYWRCADAGGYFMYDIGSSPITLYAASVLETATGIEAGGGSVVGGAKGFGTSLIQRTSTSPFSIECWCWLFNANSVNVLTGITRLGVGGTDFLLLASDSSVGYQINSQTTSLVSNVVPTYNVWNHVVATYDGTTHRLYVNAVQIATFSSPSGSLNAQGTFVVANPNNHAALAECAFYASTLSPTRITAHYNAVSLPQSPPISVGQGVDLSAVLNAVTHTYANTP